MLLDFCVKPLSFKCSCVRIVFGLSSCVAAVIYRPGSEAVSALFFKDLSNVFLIGTSLEPVFVAGDFNVCLDRPSHLDAGQFNALLTTYALVSHVTTATHDRGGILDTVATRDDLSSPHVDVIDVGL